AVATKYLVDIIDADTNINSSCESELKKPDYADLDVQCHEKAEQPDNDDELDEGEVSQDENEEQEENYQPKKRKRSVRMIDKEKKTKR
ncbi:6741_t:CDS:1, partial [Cetraspora pellucida]